jgi:hypothetical protein
MIIVSFVAYHLSINDYNTQLLLLFAIMILSTFIAVGYYYNHYPFRFAAAQRGEDEQHPGEDNVIYSPVSLLFFSHNECTSYISIIMRMMISNGRYSKYFFK